MKLLFTFVGLLIGNYIQAQSHIKYLKLRNDELATIVKTYKIRNNQLVEIKTIEDKTYKAEINFISEDTIAMNSKKIFIGDIQTIKFSPRRKALLETGLLTVGITYFSLGVWHYVRAAKINNVAVIESRGHIWAGSLLNLAGLTFSGSSILLIRGNWENAKPMTLKNCTYSFKHKD